MREAVKSAPTRAPVPKLSFLISATSDRVDVIPGTVIINDLEDLFNVFTK
jgi:hypothetical protein